MRGFKINFQKKEGAVEKHGSFLYFSVTGA
jgi:hypothetical protein